MVGRVAELDVLLRLVDGASERGGALVVRGEEGVGKTALLDYATEATSGVRVMRTIGVECEMEFPFAAVHQLCAPRLDRLERLPDPQRDALETVFGLGAAAAPDRFLVGLAVLGLLSELAEERPLLCVVDDAQWLDRASAQTLAFVARRLLPEHVAMVFLMREPSSEFRGLPELVVEGLGDRDARELLGSVARWPLDEHVRERIIAETRGNPLALLELRRGLSPAELAGGFGLPDVLPPSGRIEESIAVRLEALPGETRLLLLVAAAEPVGDSALLWRAAERLGLRIEAGEYADAAGLLEIGARVQFRHPLVRSAVYRAASLGDRRKVHLALAEVTDLRIDPDRRAWHRARATVGLDEEVAAELEQSAGRAQQRGGLAASAAFLERAVGLTADPTRRAERALAAARAKHLAGASGAALRLLAIAQAEAIDELARARVDTLWAQIAFASSRGRSAHPLLLQAAKRLEPLDAGLARETYLDAISAAHFAGHLARGGAAAEVANAALAAPPRSRPPRASDLLLDGLATRFTHGYAAAAPTLKRALSSFRSEGMSAEEELRWISLVCPVALDLWDDETWEGLAARHVKVAREAGALTALPLALSMRMLAHAMTGRLAAAASLNEEAHAAGEAIGDRLQPSGSLVVAAWRGQEEGASRLIEATISEASTQGEGLGLAAAQWASAVLYNGLARHDAARDAAWQAFERDALGYGPLVVSELAEAASRTGRVALVRVALEWISERARVTPTDWALGIEARIHAFVSEGEIADDLYCESIERLAATRVRVELARAHLLYGEWLRRDSRRVDARLQLRAAHDQFTSIGMDAFAERARRELLATGERVRKRTVETRDDLTAQEEQIARLASDGLSNPEIGARLFLSPRTVEWHLRKVFAKLGIHSRRELANALPSSDSELVPA